MALGGDVRKALELVEESIKLLDKDLSSQETIGFDKVTFDFHEYNQAVASMCIARICLTRAIKVIDEEPS